MKKTVVACLLALFLCSGCALVGYNPNHDAKMEILNSQDWSSYDTRKLHEMINMLSDSSSLPYTWTSSTNPEVDYSMTNIRSFIWSNYFAKECTLVKKNKNSGATVTTVITALKDNGWGGSRMPGPCDYDKYEYSFCMK